MKSKEITELAIKRHDIDAADFQKVYTEPEQTTAKETVFIYGRKLVLDELELVLAGLPKGSKVLDVGCGTGHLTNWIKEKGYDTCGIEPSNEMYNYARKNFPDIEIKKAISSNIPYPDDSFDLVVSFEVLRYLDDMENRKTYHEFHRVLKPGGVFFVTQVNMFSADLYYFFHKTKSVISKITNSTHHHCNFTTSAAQIKQVKDAGFRSVKTVGVFWGSVRFLYKFGKKVGGSYAALIEKISKQKAADSFRKNIAAHLIVIGKK